MAAVTEPEGAQKKIAVLASGKGSTLEYLLHASQSGFLKAAVIMVVVDRGGSGAEEIARSHGIPLLKLSRASGEEEMSRCIERALAGKADLLVCAGFLSILTSPLLEAFAGRIINIHPALLPDFGGRGMYGLKVHQAVIHAGADRSGATVHLVDKGIDSGKVLFRRRVPVFPSDPPELLAERVKSEEKPLLVESINELLFPSPDASASSLRVAVIGQGGREHALCWKLLRDSSCGSLLALPGNGGTATLSRCRNHRLPESHRELAALLRSEGIDLVVIGPEVPLIEGMADTLRREGFPVFGPGADAAALEGSKAFAKGFMSRHGVATAAWADFSADRLNDALDFARSLGWRVAVKADGPASGKGVILCSQMGEVEAALKECFSGHFGISGRRVVIEELLRGPELSLFVLTDGVESLLLPSAMDYKRAFDGDKGLNSGGMGSVAPAPAFTAEIKSAFISTILEPTLKGLREESLYFRGVLFFGLILTAQGPKLLEYNVRFGDPETQSLMPLLPDNFLELLSSCARGTLVGGTCEAAAAASACTVVAVTADYPESSGEAVPVTSLPDEEDHLIAFVAGAVFPEGVQSLVSCGGRVVSVTAWGESREEAVCGAYRGMEKVQFQGMRWRRDIGGGCSSRA